MTTAAALAQLCATPEQIKHITLHAEGGETALIVAMEREAAMAVYQAYACQTKPTNVPSPVYMRTLLDRMAAHLENAVGMNPVQWGMQAIRLINEVKALNAQPITEPAEVPAVGGTD